MTGREPDPPPAPGRPAPRSTADRRRGTWLVGLTLVVACFLVGQWLFGDRFVILRTARVTAHVGDVATIEYEVRGAMEACHLDAGCSCANIQIVRDGQTLHQGHPLTGCLALRAGDVIRVLVATDAASPLLQGSLSMDLVIGRRRVARHAPTWVVEVTQPLRVVPQRSVAPDLVWGQPFEIEWTVTYARRDRPADWPAHVTAQSDAWDVIEVFHGKAQGDAAAVVTRLRCRARWGIFEGPVTLQVGADRATVRIRARVEPAFRCEPGLGILDVGRIRVGRPVPFTIRLWPHADPGVADAADLAIVGTTTVAVFRCQLEARLVPQPAADEPIQVQGQIVASQAGPLDGEVVCLLRNGLRVAWRVIGYGD